MYYFSYPLCFLELSSRCLVGSIVVIQVHNKLFSRLICLPKCWVGICVLREKMGKIKSWETIFQIKIKKIKKNFHNCWHDLLWLVHNKTMSKLVVDMACWEGSMENFHDRVSLKWVTSANFYVNFASASHWWVASECLCLNALIRLSERWASDWQSTTFDLFSMLTLWHTLKLPYIFPFWNTL